MLEETQVHWVTGLRPPALKGTGSDDVSRFRRYDMKIGIIGTGTVGRSLATRLAEKGHEVLVSNSRGPESVVEVLGAAGAGVFAGTTDDALACDVVFLTVPWTAIREVLGSRGPSNGSILVDATNIFLRYPPDAVIDDLNGDTGSEIVARMVPDAHVVKAFNTVPFDILFAPLADGMRRVLFVAGDDERAVTVISDLIAELGFRPVSLGTLASAGPLMELGGPLSGLDLWTPAPDGR
ncbi:MAG: NADPH-dependent F420 reductase [Alphaproteobacteria bacterium]